MASGDGGGGGGLETGGFWGGAGSLELATPAESGAWKGVGGAWKSREREGDVEKHIA